MYRPKKKQLRRRLSVTSALVLVGATGLGVALASQSGGASSALRSSASSSAPASTASPATSALSTPSISTPVFHVVSRAHDDGGRESDD